MKPIPAASRSGGCQEPKSGAAKLRELSAASEPTRAMVRLMPIAKDSSLPLNQRPRTVVAATMSGSAPSPRRKRPAIMTAWVLPKAMTTPPAAVSTPNAIMARLVPTRSTTTPPARRMRSAATL